MFLKKLKKRKGIVVLLVAVAGIAGLFLFLNKDKAPNYDFIVAERKAIVQEVTVTGSVKPAERVELAFEKSGTVSKLPVPVGQRVTKGELLAQLNTQDAQQQVRSAEVELEGAKVTLEKTRLEYTQLLRGDTLNENYEDGLATLTDLYNEYQDILDDLDSVFFGSELPGGQETNIQYYTNTTKEFAAAPRLEKLYSAAQILYQQSLLNYQLAQRGGGQERQAAIQSGYDLAVHTAEMIKIGRDAIRSFQDKILTGSTVHTKQTTIDEHISTLNAQGTTMSTYVTDLLVIVGAINSEQDSEKNYPLTISSQELTVKQRQIALQEAKDNLAKYSIAAPIDALLAKRDIQIGENAAANTPILTLISEAEYEIEANVPEADIAKIRLENTAALTLDAYGRDELFQAKVVKIDPSEIIIDGVPTYKVTLHFTEADSRVKSGMTANISITSAEKDNAISIPQRALIREGEKKLVRILRGTAIERVEVETGLQGSDGNIEITRGLQEGDKVIVFFQEED